MFKQSTYSATNSTSSPNELSASLSVQQPMKMRLQKEGDLNREKFAFLFISISIYYFQSFYNSIAADLSEKNTSLVSFFLYAPQIFFKLFGPAFLPLWRESFKMGTFLLFSFASSLLAFVVLRLALAERVRLVCASLAMIASSVALVLAETSVLSKVSFYPRTCLAYWSVGCGLSGLLAACTGSLLSTFELDPANCVLFLLLLPNFAFLLNFAALRIRKTKKENQKVVKEDLKKLTLRAKLRIIVVEMRVYFVSVFLCYTIYALSTSGVLQSIAKTYEKEKRLALTIIRVFVFVARSMPVLLSFDFVCLFPALSVFAAFLLFANLLLTKDALKRTGAVLGKSKNYEIAKFLGIYVGSAILGTSHGAVGGFGSLYLRNKFSGYKRTLGLGYASLACPIGQSLGALLGLVVEKYIL